VDSILDFIKHSELINVQKMEYFTELDSIFASLDYVLTWLQQQLEAWEVGLATLATGMLSPQILSLLDLYEILVAINKQLTLGWTIPTNDLWVLYREASVAKAMFHNKFRLFIEIPIFDHAQHFNLFKVIGLPKATVNGSHLVIYRNLPNFLAVSPDLDTFFELQDSELQNCRDLDKLLCRFHTGLARRGSRKSCAISLFTQDEKRIQTTCQTQFLPWMGPEIAYLGCNRWAFSAIGPHDVVFSSVANV
jgi:hypothetical protein